MIYVKRSEENPILIPNKENEWEAKAVFNGSVVKCDNLYRMVYRAVAPAHNHLGAHIELSTIGIAESADGIHFHHRRQLLKPEENWEQYGLEDPRVTILDDRYYIFYTALSQYPPGKESIKVALAITDRFEKIVSKHLITPFNAKAAGLFPERINGKLAMVLTANTDNPPATIGVALFDRESDMWSRSYWEEWLKDINKHRVHLHRDSNDHIEVGAVPVKTKDGWLLIHSYIQNYFKPPAVFGIEAVLLDLNDPRTVIGRTRQPLLVPREYYEMYGDVPNVIFPSGAFVENDNLVIYYGAADTSIARAETPLSPLILEMISEEEEETKIKLVRFEHNPIIEPVQEHKWESQNTFNPTALYLDGKVHILYRAMDAHGVSTIGYAVSSDGFKIDERLSEPIYVPREEFEKNEEGPYGCEDPRVTVMGDTIYMCYTAYDGGNKAGVALTSISTSDFLGRNWNWKTPVIISPPKMFDKNACVVPRKINGKYALFHRIDHYIWIDYTDSLDFDGKKWIEGEIVMKPRQDKWDNFKIGIAGAPIETESGWVLLYHGLSKQDGQYRVGAALLDLTDLDNVLRRLDDPILEPKEEYEISGERPGTVFPCGAVLVNDVLFVYYGGADQVTCGATIAFNKLLRALTSKEASH